VFFVFFVLWRLRMCVCLRVCDSIILKNSQGKQKNFELRENKIENHKFS